MASIEHWYSESMTQMDVKFRYEQHPSEDSMLALGKLKEVYGIRRVLIDEEWKIITIEYDATRLTVPVVEQLLRRGGIDIVERLPLIPVQPEPVPAPAAAPAK
jgi:hypothetical protein